MTSPVPAKPATPGPCDEATRRPRILVLDGDVVSRRFAEASLSAAGFSVESATTGAAALELLASNQVSLVLSEAELPDMNGLALVRRLRQEHRLRDVPVVFLTADRRRAMWVIALRAGVEDVLAKPCAAEELAARCESIVARRRRSRYGLQRRGYTLAGDFRGLPFDDLVSLLASARRSGVLSLATPNASGHIRFSRGEVVDAAYGNVSGADAFYGFLEEEEAQFEFTPGPQAEGEAGGLPVVGLLMEAARRLDVARRDAKAGVPAPAPPWRREPRTGGGLERPTAPDAGLARKLQAAVRDPFALGELKLFEARQLEDWTRSAVGRDRFHVHLVADPGEGVGALLPLGGALTEQLVLDALGAGRKWLGLAFFLRRERAFDALLIDAGDPAAALPWLKRAPALVLYAPPRGDLLEAGTRGRSSLANYLRALRPAAVLGCGDATLAGSLARLCAAESPSTRVRSVEGLLGRAGSTLRELLVEGLGHWASAVAPPVGAA